MRIGGHGSVQTMTKMSLLAWAGRDTVEWVRRVACMLCAAVVLSAAGLVFSAAARVASPREKLLAAKQAAYEANFKNDAAGLQEAAEKLDALASDKELGASALYYAGWT